MDATATRTNRAITIAFILPTFSATGFYLLVYNFNFSILAGRILWKSII